MKSNSRREDIMNVSTLEEAGKHLGLIAGIIGSLLVIWKFIYSPIRKFYERRKALRDTLATVCKTCDDMNTRFNKIEKMFDELTEKQESRHKEDLLRWRTLCGGQVASIAAMREIAAHQGLKINGPVELFYQQNISALEHSLKITD